jgi:hypothetical protein
VSSQESSGNSLLLKWVFYSADDMDAEEHNDNTQFDAIVAHRHNANPLGRLLPEVVCMVIKFATISAARTPIDGLGEANCLLRTVLSSCSILCSSALQTPLSWSFIQYIYPDSQYDEDSVWQWLSQHLEMSSCLTFYLQIDLS